jgi:hypothetical protein
MDHIRLKIFPTLIRVTRDGTPRWIPATEQRPHDIAHETVKYLQPKGSTPRLYFVSACRREVVEGDGALWLIEGEKKAAAAAQVGLPAVGFCGVDGWHGRGQRDLIEDFDAIPLRDRVVELVPDGDYRSNPQVARAIRQFGAALTARGARPRVVILPSELPR